MDLILNAFTEFMTTFVNNMISRLQSVNVIVGICFAILGVSTAILARRITRIIRKRNEIDSNDGAIVAIKAVGLVFMLVAFIILLVQSIA